MGIELLTKARLTLVDSDTPSDTTDPVPAAIARDINADLPVIVSLHHRGGRGPRADTFGQLIARPNNDDTVPSLYDVMFRTLTRVSTDP
jgi:hypothetical protein